MPGRILRRRAAGAGGAKMTVFPADVPVVRCDTTSAKIAAGTSSTLRRKFSDFYGAKNRFNVKAADADFALSVHVDASGEVEAAAASSVPPPQMITYSILARCRVFDFSCGY